MFFNIKLNGKKLFKLFFIFMLIIILIIFSFGIYTIFLKKNKTLDKDLLSLSDAIVSDEIFEITESNYTNILQAVSKDLDSYIGCKIHFVGFVYRLIDFEEDQFVLARNMIINKDTGQSLIVGFLCKYDKASNFKDNTWIDVTGTIKKGNYYGEIAEIEVTSIYECKPPKEIYVSMPDNSYIPTSNMF